MNYEEILKALSNPARWQIMQWLKHPKKHFAHQQADINEFGVCCGLIQEKVGMSQSTVSHYLKILERCGLLQSKRQGQWTFYSRNEANIKEFMRFIDKTL